MFPDSNRHVFCDLLFHLPSPQHSAHTSMYTPPSINPLDVQHCADQCCFPARLSCSSAWMHSHQIKPALAASDLLAPPRHPRGPLSLHRHLSFYPSFDISAPSVISEVPLSAEVLLWHKWGVSPQIPAGLHVFHHKGAQYFLIVLRHYQNLHPSRQGSELNNYFGQKCFLKWAM